VRSDTLTDQQQMAQQQHILARWPQMAVIKSEMKALRRRSPDTVMVLMIFSIFSSVYSSRFGPSEPESGFSTFPKAGGLLVLHRACLSALLYKSIKRCAYSTLITQT
jgi:hypothetical protein